MCLCRPRWSVLTCIHAFAVVKETQQVSPTHRCIFHCTINQDIVISDGLNNTDLLLQQIKWMSSMKNLFYHIAIHKLGDYLLYIYKWIRCIYTVTFTKTQVWHANSPVYIFNLVADASLETKHVNVNKDILYCLNNSCTSCNSCPRATFILHLSPKILHVITISGD